jgi:hypothetical protein
VWSGRAEMMARDVWPICLSNNMASGCCVNGTKGVQAQWFSSVRNEGLGFDVFPHRQGFDFIPFDPVEYCGPSASGAGLFNGLKIRHSVSDEKE